MSAFVVYAGSLLLAGATVLAGTSASSSDAPVSADREHTASESMLRLAVSPDGSAFDDAGPITRGTAPALVLLPNGHLLLVFDQAIDGKELDVSLAVMRSRDQGRTWSLPQPARIVDTAGHPIRGRHAALVQTPNKRIRMYFATDWRGSTVVLSAVTRNGLDFRVDVADPLMRGGESDPCPQAAPLDGQVCVWISHTRKDDPRGESKPRVDWFLSPDGQRFRSVQPLRLPDPGVIDSAVGLDNGVRAFATTPEGIRSLVSTNGLALEPEPGIRVPRGTDPTVACLPDGSYAMVYCADARSSRDRGGKPQAGEFLVGTDDGGAGAGNEWWWEPFDEVPGDARAANAADTTNGSESPYAADGTSSIGDGFAPIPDLTGSCDYVGWFRQQSSMEVPDDASPAYGALMPNWFGPGGGDPDWPNKFDDMLNGGESVPIGPWDPLDHPNWEATHQTIQPLLDQFRLASRYENCSAPLRFPCGDAADSSDRPPMLVDYLLPSLNHHRAMVKATLADAWRLGEDGCVPPDRLIDALEVSLRAAGHLDQAPTLIHRLVSMSEKSLAQNSAREALAQGLIPDDRLEEAFQKLVAADRPPADPANWVRFEHAMAMDMLQNLYQPSDTDGQAELDVDLFNRLFNTSEGDEADSPQAQEKIAGLRSEAPAQVAADLDAYYRDLADLWEIGTPEVGTQEVMKLEEEACNQSTLGSLITPSLSRAYGLSIRSEASRRATQLSYAMHVFKARNGRWPYSLDELPPEVDATMRTDPFSGSDFVYRVTSEGPTLYSTSDNGVDDGGIHSRRFGDGVAEGESDDFVFWPPQ